MSLQRILRHFDTNGIMYKTDVKVAELVSFKVGGVVSVVVYPKSINQLMIILRLVKNEKHYILGKGTNCYFKDGIYEGFVVVTAFLRHITADFDTITALCGDTCFEICRFARERALSGIEFAYGIPGTLGGAIAMNASAFGSSFSDVVLDSTVYDYESDTVITITAAEHNFDTKKSVFSDRNYCLLQSRIKLNFAEKDSIASKMRENLEKRIKSQPLDMPSAGSTFVKPKDTYASYMIDKCGLKGVSVGGAAVSTKHAGFIVNTGCATASDVQKLIIIIKQKVLECFNVELKEEIILID